MTGQLLQAFLGLCFVLGLIFFFAFLVKRYGGHLMSGALNTAKKPELELLEIKSVDHKNRLVLARCKQSEYLLLVGESSSLIDRYSCEPEQKHAD